MTETTSCLMVGLNRKQLDDAFPTIVRYSGIVVAFVCVVATLLGHGLELAAGYVLATGMIAYKSVREAAHNGEER